MSAERRHQTVLITGATKGIGRAITLLLALQGYDIAFCSRHIEDVQDLETWLHSTYPDQQFIGCCTDLTDESQLQTFAQAARQHLGDIDVLINNAGVFLPGNVLEEEENTLHQQWQLNVLSMYRMCRLIAPSMKNRRHGHIVNLGSIAGTRAYPNGGSYCITKYAVHGLTDVLREELRAYGVAVTLMVPGATWSDSWSGVDLPDDRLMKADDIARIVASVLTLEPSAMVETVVVRPQLGDL